MREIRKQLKNVMLTKDEIAEGFSGDYIDYDTAVSIIDDIETKVNEIKDRLESHTTLTEIKEIYDLADKLSNELY